MVKKTLLIFSLLLLTAMVGSAVAFDIPEIYTTIQVNPGLRGDVLLAYLYDVRDLDGVAQKTLINIVNTDPNYGMVARFRFREYKRSHECLDFHFPLSAGDVWSAEVFRGTNGAYIYSDDFTSKDVGSNTFWYIRKDLNKPDLANPDLTLVHPDPVVPTEGDGINFNAAQADSNINRCLYGYFEVIGEERVAKNFVMFGSPDVNNNLGTVNRLTPTTACGPGFTGLNPCGMDAQNSLFGETWLVRVEDGTAQQYQDVAISNFAVNPNGIADSVQTDNPNLFAAVQGAPGNPGVGGFNQLEAVLSKRDVFVQYWDDWAAFAARTSAVFTFPTKWAHFAGSPNYNLGGVAGGAPFVGDYETIQEANPDAFALVVRDREENILTVPTSDIIFSPFSSTGPKAHRWPFEVNICGIYNFDRSSDFYTPPGSPPHSVSDVSLGLPAGSIFRDNLWVATFAANTVPYKYGWIDFDLSPDPSELPSGVTGDQGKTVNFNWFDNDFTDNNYSAYRGLPVIGGVLTEVSAPPFNYRTAVPWAYAVDWAVAGP